MSTLTKWNTYLKERSPLPALIFISAIGSISSLSFRQNFDACLFLAGIILNTLIFIQLRLGDEIKDFEKDKIVNPTRPLPRDLLSIDEVSKVLKGLLFFIVVCGIIIGFTYSWMGASALMATTVFAWLMYKEFYIGDHLAKEPMTYALSHQIIVFSLYGWIGLSADPTLIHESYFQGWLLANFGASFTFEICRKLNPDAHKLAGTYAHHYGRLITVVITSVFVLIMGIGSHYSGFGLWMILPLILLEFLLINWIKKPKSFKAVEGVATLAGIIVAAAPAIMWLLKGWN